MHVPQNSKHLNGQTPVCHVGTATAWHSTLGTVTLQHFSTKLRLLLWTHPSRNPVKCSKVYCDTTKRSAEIKYCI
jgi:hypothetical protein